MDKAKPLSRLRVRNKRRGKTGIKKRYVLLLIPRQSEASPPVKKAAVRVKPLRPKEAGKRKMKRRRRLKRNNPKLLLKKRSVKPAAQTKKRRKLRIRKRTSPLNKFVPRSTHGQHRQAQAILAPAAHIVHAIPNQHFVTPEASVPMPAPHASDMAPQTQEDAQAALQEAAMQETMHHESINVQPESPTIAAIAKMFTFGLYTEDLEVDHEVWQSITPALPSHYQIPDPELIHFEQDSHLQDVTEGMYAYADAESEVSVPPEADSYQRPVWLEDRDVTEK